MGTTQRTKHPVSPTSEPTTQAPVPLATAGQLAVYLGVTRATVYNLMKRGLPSIKVASARRFRISDVDGWIEGQQTDTTIDAGAA